MFSSVPSTWSSVSSWLGVGQRPSSDGEDDKKENKEPSEDKDTSNSNESSSKEETVKGSTKEQSNKSTDTPQGESSTSEPSNEEQQSPLNIDSLKDLNLEEVSQKALSHAKDIGSMLWSFGKTASKTVADTASTLKHTVEEQTILGDFHKEQDKWCSSNKAKAGKAEAAVAPWVGYNDEENLKAQIMALSLDKRNFVRNPPSGVQFQFDFESCYPVANATLQEDMNLKKMRFELVPKAVTEVTFWRNYFYRVSLIRQSSQLSVSLSERSGKSSSNSSRRGSIGSLTSSESEQKECSTTSKEKTTEADEMAVGSPPTQDDDFVSDAFGESQISEDDIRREMEEQLKQSTDEGGRKLLELASEDVGSDEEWEKELMDEIMEMKDGDE